MKKFLCIISFLPIAALAQKSFDIKGKVGHLNKPAMAYLAYQVDGKRVLDSIGLVNGQFEFKGSIATPKEAHIRIKHDSTPDPVVPLRSAHYDVLAFFLENTKIKLEAPDSICHATITGSKLNDENKALTKVLKPYYDRYDSLNEEYGNQPGDKKNDPQYIASLDRRADSLTSLIVQVKTRFAIEHPNSFMALQALASTYGDHFDAVRADSIFNTFSPEIQESDLGKLSKSRIAETKKTQAGVLAEDIQQPDAAGNIIHLSDFKGKYVLLDFWASWCGPCRRENPNLVKTYAQYRSRGFEILGVSLDKAADRQKWLDAIQKDSLTWPQTADLKGWDNTAAKAYNIQAIPMNFLIDPNGRIIAKYLRGEALDAKLKEILH